MKQDIEDLKKDKTKADKVNVILKEENIDFFDLMKVLKRRKKMKEQLKNFDLFTLCLTILSASVYASESKEVEKDFIIEVSNEEITKNDSCTVDVVEDKKGSNKTNTTEKRILSEQDIVTECIKEFTSKLSVEPMEINVYKWIELIKKHKNIKKLDKETLNELIKKIYVHEKEVTDG